MCVPNTPQPDERGPQSWCGTFLVDLIKDCLAIDEVGVATEGYKRGGSPWRFRTIWGKALLALSSKARSLQLTKGQVEFCGGWAMDEPNLKTGVHIAKGYRGRHEYRA